MKFETATALHDLAPAIDPGIEKVTAAMFHSLNRVIIEVKPTSSPGFRKLNAISLEDWPPQSRTSEQEDELNTAIMLVATSYVAETDESMRFRARYMSTGPDGEELRRYMGFKVLTDDDEVTVGKFQLPAPGPSSGLEQWMPFLRWVVAMLESRERMMMAYNEVLTDKLLLSAAQAEPLLRAQGKVAKMSEQAMTMAFQAAVTQGAAVGAQQMLPEVPEDDSFGSEVLKPGLEIALQQLLNRGAKAPPGSPSGFPGVPTAPPPAGAPQEGTGASREKTEAAEPPATQSGGSVEVDGALVRTIAMWLGSMDGTQMLGLMAMLSPEESRSFQAVGAAKNDDTAAKAVLGFQDALVESGNGIALFGLLDTAQKEVLVRIQAMAKMQAEPASK